MKISQIPAIAAVALLLATGSQAATASVQATPYATSLVDMRSNVQTHLDALGVKGKARTLSYDKLSRINAVLKSMSNDHMKASQIKTILKHDENTN